MERITYIAPNLMDWVAQIKAGAATVRVHFSGGSLTAYGVTPAEFTTESKFIQQVIERSAYFKEGRIQIGRRVEIPEAVKPKAKQSKTAVSAPAPATQATAGPKAEVAEKTHAAEQTETGYKEVEVSCLQDAQDYLQQNFGISSYKVRSKPSAQKVAMEHGVMFVGRGFGEAETGEGTEAND